MLVGIMTGHRLPLHIVIRQYRVVPLIITLFFMWLTVDIVEFLKLHYDDIDNAVAGVFGSVVLLAGGSVKWSLEQMTKKQEKDDG